VSDLREQLDEGLPEPLILHEGEAYVGRYLRLVKAHAEYRGDVWVMVVEGDDGERRSLWLLHQALLNGLKRLQPKLGEMVGVKNLGKRKSATGSDYVDWRVLVDRPPPGWDAIDPADGEP
jgi:hypothetical protein